MRRVRVLGLALALLVTGSVTLAADEPFVSIFGGYAGNDDSTKAEDTIPFGVRLGTETPVAGAQLSLTVNRDGDIKMDTAMVEMLFHFGSSDARTRRNRILYNRVSGFGIVGLGGMRYDAGAGVDAAWIFSYSLGMGMQVKLSRKVGIRIQLESVGTGPNNIGNFTADAGVAVYF